MCGPAVRQPISGSPDGSTPPISKRCWRAVTPQRGHRWASVLRDRTLSSGKVVRAVAGFDATFSAPKSLSVWWALTRDPGLLDSHDIAVRAAADHLEQFGATTRIRVDGRRQHPDSLGLTVATFRQTTSRADDPQVHTHAVVSAKVQTDDGRWLALDARYLKRHQRMLGGLYQSVLRAELTHRYGVAWEPTVHGQAELAGLSRELLDVFSKRAGQVDHALAVKVDEFRRREGRDPTTWERAALCREASADTRAHKTGNGVGDLRTRWAAEAAELDWTASRLGGTIDAARLPRDEAPQIVTVDEVIDRLSAGGSTWTRADVLRAICDLQPTLSERVLRRCALLAPFADLAAAHHERADGSGYHRGAAKDQLDVAARLLATADAYHAMTEDRPHRPALSAAEAASQLLDGVDTGRFGRVEVDAVLQAAGHVGRPVRTSYPAGLTDREVEVLRLIARGYANKQAAAELGIATKTVGHHIEHIYAKAGVATRAGATLFAMEHGLLSP